MGRVDIIFFEQWDGGSDTTVITGVVVTVFVC